MKKREIIQHLRYRIEECSVQIAEVSKIENHAIRNQLFLEWSARKKEVEEILICVL